MAIRLIADSCCDTTPALHKVWKVHLVPFVLRVGEREFTDNEALDTGTLLEAMEACSTAIARDMVLEESPEKKIALLDSESATAGEVLLIHSLRRWIDEGAAFETVVSRAQKMIREMSTLFVLESLDNLVKNGRISKAAGLVSTMLSLRPIMGDDGHGEIICLHKVRGTANAMKKLVQVVAERTRDLAARSRDLVITYCACKERAAALREELLEKCPAVREIVTVPTAGLSTVYANRGGVVVAF